MPLNAREIAPGLWYWSVVQPGWDDAEDWPEQVGQACYEGTDSLVLFDPLVPADDEAAFWDFVDQRRDDTRLSVRVLLTAPWHERSVEAVSDRYGATVWAHPAGHARLSISVVDDALPDGVEQFVLRGVDEGEVAFYISAAQTLFVAEFLTGVDGGLALVPSPAIHDRALFRASLDLLVAKPIERVIVAHGDSIFENGHTQIAKALNPYSPG
jgi:hypothetical protein